MSRHRAPHQTTPRRLHIRGGVLTSHTRQTAAAGILLAAVIGGGATFTASQSAATPIASVVTADNTSATALADRLHDTASRQSRDGDNQMTQLAKRLTTAQRAADERAAAAAAQAASEDAAKKALADAAAKKAAEEAAAKKAADEIAAQAAAKKATTEAAEAAANKKAAEVAATQAASPTKTPASRSTTSASATSSAGAGSYKDYARAQVGSDDQFSCLEHLWGKESGWNPNAQNPSSTAYGIPQFLDSTWKSTGIAKTSDGYRQIDAGLIYLDNRYGSPCGGWAHSQATGWY